MVRQDGQSTLLHWQKAAWSVAGSTVSYYMRVQCINKRERESCVILNQMVRERRQNKDVEERWTLAF